MKNGNVLRSLSSLAGLSALLLLNPCPAAATIFASDGWGWWWACSEPGALGRGGTSVTATGYGATGMMNPASIGHAELNYGFAAYSAEVADVEGSAGTFRQRQDQLPNIGGVIRLPAGLRVALMFRTQTEANYDRMTEVGGDTDIGPYVLRAKGTGGLSRFQLHIARSFLADRLSLGAGAFRTQGTVKDQITYDFEDSESLDIRQAVEAHLQGAFGFTTGMVLRVTPILSFGGSASWAGTSDVEQEVVVLAGTNKTEKTEGEQDLPAEYAAGISVDPGERWRLSAEWSQAAWSGTGGVAGSAYRDAERWGVGLEYGPKAQVKSGWVWRAGFSSGTHYVETRDGASVDERIVSLGLRRAAAGGRAAIDAALQLGTRGDKGDIGAEERFARLSIGLGYSSTLREY